MITSNNLIQQRCLSIIRISQPGNKKFFQTKQSHVESTTNFRQLLLVIFMIKFCSTVTFVFLQAHQWFHDYFVLFRILTLQANFNASIPQLFCSQLY